MEQPILSDNSSWVMSSALRCCLSHVPKGVALKVPLAELTESKEKVRSALNRATRKGSRNVATASDGTFLYVWNET